ncbi:MAG: hypothetical protein A2Y79_08820 [Deltaproteobacteria bacterium RBG_13_43_22]|nr:MAG: hypothetical protein A2Y79_08820 [Deltaproteobacteria bacterium RBG_13_43_22]
MGSNLISYGVILQNIGADIFLKIGFVRKGGGDFEEINMKRSLFFEREIASFDFWRAGAP